MSSLNNPAQPHTNRCCSIFAVVYSCELCAVVKRHAVSEISGELLQTYSDPVCHGSSGGFGVEFGDKELHIERDCLSLRWNINGLREVESGVARNKTVFLSVQIQSPRDFTNDTVAIGISGKPISVDEFELRPFH